MFEAMGVATGIDLDKLIAARAPLQAGLPGEPIYGMTPEAGLPRDFVPADARCAWLRLRCRLPASAWSSSPTW